MQFARPISTTAAGEWTASAGTLHSCIDETSPSDTDFITHAWVAANNTASFGLTSLITPVGGTHTLRVRARMRNPGPYVGVTDLTITLRSAGTAIASQTWNLNRIGTTWTTLERVLTSGEVAAITDYTALSIDITREGFLVLAGETMDVSWFEYEMPADASTGSFSLQLPFQSINVAPYDYGNGTHLPSRANHRVWISQSADIPAPAGWYIKPLSSEDARQSEICSYTGSRFPGHAVVWVDGRPYGAPFAPTPDPREFPDPEIDEF